MNSDVLQRDLAHLRGTIRFQRIVVIFLLAFVAVALASLFVAVGRERTIVSPPVIHKSFWVEADKLSAAYLEQMGEFIAHCILNVTPSNVDYKQLVVLQYVNPDVYGELKEQMKLAAEQLQRDNATTMFFPKMLTPYEDKMALVINGMLSTYVNDRKVSDVPKTYTVEFRYQGGKVSLSKFKEVDSDPYQERVLPVGTARASQ